MKLQISRTIEYRIFLGLAVFLGLLLACIHRNWLFSLSPLISGDWPYFSAVQLQEWLPFHDLWISYDGLGRSMSQGNFVWLFSMYGWLAKIGLGFEIIARLLFFLPIIILAPYGAYLAVKQLTNHRLSALIGAFVYSLNTYFLVIQGGHMHLSMVYALAPLAYYFALKDGPRSYFWMFAIIAIMGLYDVRMTLVVSVFAVIIALWRKVKTRRDFVQHAKKIGLGFLLVALVHSFWILPTIFTSSGPFTRNVFQQAALNWVSQTDSLALHHPFWSESGVTDFVFQPAPFYMFLLPLVAFIPFTIATSRFKREMLFFGSACLLSIILLMQENSLFKDAYQVVYDNVPLMSMFRESTKLFFITSFCYSVLIGLLIAELFRRERKDWAMVSGGAVLLALIIPAAPYLSGSFVKAFKKEPIRADMRELNRIAGTGENTRTLWISRVPKFVTSSDQRPSVDALELGQRYWSRYSDPFDSLSFLKQPYTAALLNFASVGHVVVPHNSIDSVYTHYKNTPAKHYERQIDRLNLPGRQEVNSSTIWENNHPKPHFYMATDIVRVDSLGVFSGMDTETTAAYLFADQQPAVAQAVFNTMPTNIELNPFQASHLQIDNEQITTSYQPPKNLELDLYKRQPDASMRSLVKVPNADTNQPITQTVPGLKNLYPGGALESDNSFKVSDCNNYDNTSTKQNGIGGTLIQDKAANRTALQVTAQRHIACFSKKIEQFDPEAYYLIGLDYQHVSGPMPRLGLYPYFSEPINRQTALPSSQSNKWTSYQTLVGPNDFTEEMYLNFYLPTDKHRESKTLFDNIRVYKLPYVPEAYLRTNQPGLPPATVQDVEHTPRKHRLTVEDLTRPRLLVFSETFDPNWRLSVRKIGEQQRLGISDFISGKHVGYTLDANTHVVANGFANGWWIDPATLPETIRNSQGEYELVLEYMPQRWFTIGLLTSATTILACGLYATYSIWRKPKERRRR